MPLLSWSLKISFNRVTLLTQYVYLNLKQKISHPKYPIFYNGSYKRELYVKIYIYDRFESMTNKLLVKCY